MGSLPLPALVITAMVFAQTGSMAPKPGTVDTAHLSVTTSVDPASVPPGGRLSLVVDVVPKPRMHVYAPKEKAQQPVSVKLDRAASITAKPPIFPKGEPFLFAPTGDTQVVYSQPFRIEVAVTVVKSQRAGALAMTGTFRYQACDDKVCYIAKSVALTWEVTIR